ncbi:hypothetical protein NUW54_g7018 [Trametes sanguinea]|uniref:Uncharacterized protein n=1 Tax=Trametes sanguinea TaxID=158606 RepID=A0ACC1PPV1_9APHY|nr:hypothetical protein NUW54_g7018 [Trametes sanguinea]
MKFFSFAPVLAAVAFGAMSVVAQGATSIVNGIEQVTNLSATARDDTNSITITTASTEFPGPHAHLPAQQLIDTANQIVNTISSLAQTIQAQEGQPFGDSDAQLIVAVLKTFVTVHQQFLNALIGKHSLAEQFFFTRPLATFLRNLEGVVDAFADALIDVIPTQAPAANTQFVSSIQSHGCTSTSDLHDSAISADRLEWHSQLGHPNLQQLRSSRFLPPTCLDDESMPSDSSLTWNRSNVASSFLGTLPPCRMRLSGSKPLHEWR